LLVGNYKERTSDRGSQISILEKYPIPENCGFLSVPKLNAEIKATVQESAIKRDKRIVEKQERVAACLGAVGKAIPIALKIFLENLNYLRS